MNQFQLKSLANMSFDLAKAMFAVAVVPQLELFKADLGVKWAFIVLGSTGGVLLTVLGLYLGRKVREK